MKVDFHPPKSEPYTFRLPGSGVPQELHAALADVPGFTGITRRSTTAVASFNEPLTLSVARQVVLRAEAPVPSPPPDRFMELRAKGWDELTIIERDEAMRLVFERAKR